MAKPKRVSKMGLKRTEKHDAHLMKLGKKASKTKAVKG